MEIARIRVVWEGWSGGPGVTNLYFRKRTTSSWDQIPNQLIGQVEAALTAGADLFNSTVNATVEGDIDILEDTTGELQFSIAGNLAFVEGTGGTFEAPPGLAMLVRYLTGEVYRGHRVKGGTYLAPLSKLLIDNDGTPTDAALSAAQAFGDSISVDNSYGQLQVWSRPANGAKDDGRAFDVSDATVTNKFAMLRSRRD